MEMREVQREGEREGGLPQVARGHRGGHLHLTHTTMWLIREGGANSIVLPRRGAGPTFQNAVVGEGQGQLSLVLQPMRGGATNSVQPYHCFQ